MKNALDSTILIPMNVLGSRFRKSQLRTMTAIGVVVAAFLLQVTLVTSAYQLVRKWLGISPPPPNMLLCSAYSLLTSFRLIWWLAVAALVAIIDPPGVAPVLRPDKRQAIYFLKGLAIGFAVMAAAVVMIVAVGDAQLHSSPGSASVHAAYGVAWLLGEILGAAGEEVLYRGLILVLVARLFGMRTAIVSSALAFALAHGANPGASYVWMVRLAAAGLLLAYSVFRSGTVWWETGYHAGWNFASSSALRRSRQRISRSGEYVHFPSLGECLDHWRARGPGGKRLRLPGCCHRYWITYIDCSPERTASLSGTLNSSELLKVLIPP
jgi:membrane protease YdiL (CAAX protease family)